VPRGRQRKRGGDGSNPLILSTLGYEEVEMGVKIDFLPEGLDDGYYPGAKKALFSFLTKKPPQKTKSYVPCRINNCH